MTSEGEILGRTVHTCRLVEQEEITWESEILGKTVHRLVEHREVIFLEGRTVHWLVEQGEILWKVKCLEGQSIG